MYDGPSEPARLKTDDWRWLELLQMDPSLAMAELLTLAEAIFDARSDYQEASTELRLAEERLKRMEAQVVQAAWDEDNEAVQGKNSEVRSRKELLFLVDHPSIVPLREEVEEARLREAEAKVAMDTFLDRQKNLHSWARMFEAQARLLATVEVRRDMGIKLSIDALSEEQVVDKYADVELDEPPNVEEVDDAVNKYGGVVL
jgi:hypothetical protein